MIFHAKDPISQDITAGYHPAGMTLDQGVSIHHEAHKERTTGLEKQPDFNMLFSSFVLFVSFVVVYFG